jgi:hypothetical protein
MCLQVTALSGALLSSMVSSVLTLLIRQLFKAAAKGGEGGRAIKWSKRQSNCPIFLHSYPRTPCSSTEAEAHEHLHPPLSPATQVEQVAATPSVSGDVRGQGRRTAPHRMI